MKLPTPPAAAALLLAVGAAGLAACQPPPPPAAPDLSVHATALAPATREILVTNVGSQSAAVELTIGVMANDHMYVMAPAPWSCSWVVVQTYPYWSDGNTVCTLPAHLAPGTSAPEVTFNGPPDGIVATVKVVPGETSTANNSAALDSASSSSAPSSDVSSTSTTTSMADSSPASSASSSASSSDSSSASVSASMSQSTTSVPCTTTNCVPCVWPNWLPYCGTPPTGSATTTTSIP